MYKELDQGAAVLAGIFDQPLREAGGGGGAYHGGDVAKRGPCRGAVVRDPGQGTGEDQPVEEEGDREEEEGCGRRGRGWGLRNVHFDTLPGSLTKMSSCLGSRMWTRTWIYAGLTPPPYRLHLLPEPCSPVTSSPGVAQQVAQQYQHSIGGQQRVIVVGTLIVDLE